MSDERVEESGEGADMSIVPVLALSATWLPRQPIGGAVSSFIADVKLSARLAGQPAQRARAQPLPLSPTAWHPFFVVLHHRLLANDDPFTTKHAPASPDNILLAWATVRRLSFVRNIMSTIVNAQFRRHGYHAGSDERIRASLSPSRDLQPELDAENALLCFHFFHIER